MEPIERQPFIPYSQRPHIKSYKAKWYQENKERTRKQRLEAVKRYALKHPAKVKARLDAWKIKNKEYCLEYGRKHYYNNKTKIRNWLLTKKYGISLEKYNQILASQEECCAICGQHQSAFSHYLHVDHDHKTNKVRGLLCYNCNRALGLLQDSLDITINAAYYLEVHSGKKI